MYFTKIQKTTAQLEVMISALEMQYGAKDDETLAKLMAKYFEVNIDDARSSLLAYRTNKPEDYEQLSKQLEYVR
jgi:hypothetical protein